MSSPDPFLVRVLQTIAEQGFFIQSCPALATPTRAQKTDVLVALSGGADSTALLLALWRLRNPLKLRLFALSVNHGLRPPEHLRKEELHCQRLCKKLRVPLFQERIDVPKIARQKKISFETAAREVRYERLESVAAELRQCLIATGHHRDDQIETVLFRILRGGWIDNLSGIPYQRGRIIRPLLDCSRKEIAAFLKREQMSYVTDPTNRESKYDRNRIRHQVLPALEREYPSISHSLLSLAGQAKALATELTRDTKTFLASHTYVTPGRKLLVDRQRFTQLSQVMSSYLVREGLKTLPSPFSPISPEQASQVMNLALQRVKKVNLPNDLTASCERFPGFRIDDLIAITPKHVQRSEIAVPLEKLAKQSVTLFDGRAQMTFSRPGSNKISSDPFSIIIDADTISSQLVVRTWKAGDRMRMLGMSGSKKIGDILTDRKYPAFMRDEQLVVADNEGIIWLVGHVIADRVRITRASNRFMQLKYETFEDCL